MLLIHAIITLALTQSSKAERDGVPVFVLDHDKVMANILVQPNPLAKITTAEFIEIIHDAQKNSKVVVLFIENTFSFEDISLRDKNGTPFLNLRKGLSDKKVMYLPTVSQPFKTIKQLFHQQPFNVFHLSSMTTRLQAYDGKSKYFYIYFQDSDKDTRVEALRNHDLIMQEVYSIVRQIYAGPVVAFYTGKINAIPIHKLSFVTVKPYFMRRNPGVTIRSTGALFRLIGVYTTAGNRRSMFSQIPLVAEETWTKHHLSTRMTYSDFELQFNFKFEQDSWTIDNIMLLEGGEEVGRSSLRAGARWGQSYVCGEPLVIVNMRDGSVVTVSQYQIQPYQEKVDLFDRHIKRLTDGEVEVASDTPSEAATPAPPEAPPNTASTKGFGPSVNCGPYFNANILAALFVTFICVGILTYGFLTIYNCGSNDRFDDPHGKPLSIPMEAHH